MRIGIDARFLSEAGVGRYIKNLLYYLQELDLKNEYFILLREKDFEKIKFKNKNFNKILADISWYGVSEQIELPKILYSLKLDLAHFPHFNIPIFYRGKFVVTIHDLIHQKFKMKRATTLNPLLYSVKHHAYNFALKTALKKSEKVITVSDYVEGELRNQWNVPDNKIIVTKEGVEDKLFQIAKKCTKNDIDSVLKKFGIKPPFLFYVGNAHPHKNVEGLIKAFLKLRKNYEQSFQSSNDDSHHLQLVLSGGEHYFWERIKREAADSRLRGNDGFKNIIFTGFVSDEEMVALYKSAKVYVVPSFEEGFGIPLLEAMACGVPVASSQRASLPEVGGDAAIYFDPYSVDDMALKISTILNSQMIQRELVEKGHKRVKEFSWRKMAELTLKVYNSAE